MQNSTAKFHYIHQNGQKGSGPAASTAIINSVGVAKAPSIIAGMYPAVWIDITEMPKELEHEMPKPTRCAVVTLRRGDKVVGNLFR